MQMTLNKESPLRIVSHSISHSPKLSFVFQLKKLDYELEISIA